MNDQIKKLTVQELFKSDQYIIPLYQRNYAWGEEEVTQLIHDIWDSCRANNENSGNHYYIGSLVVAKRKDGLFEVIDGQQRHTTLSILLAYLKGQHDIEKTNLQFECRDLSSNTLHNLFEGKMSKGQPTIITAYKTCEQLFPLDDNSERGDRGIKIQEFTKYLLEHVIILRTEVPEETDLNHYFEIMNNRGEQLEKHEVLKARFMNDLNKDEKTVFAMVWDACADMNRYVVMGFDIDIRKKIFGNDLNSIPKDFDESAPCLLETKNEKENSEELRIFLESATLKEENSSQKKKEECFSSIIDFPNFLLHVLRIFKKEHVILDDKKLLDEFKERPSAMAFSYALLKYRFLFDKYIIKREHKEGKDDGKWSLKKLVFSKIGDAEKGSQSYLNTFCKENNDDDHHQSLLMIQSMFHVSYPTRNYKYWMNDALAYLCESETDRSSQDLLKYFETLSDRFFFGRFAAKKPKEYDEILKKPGFEPVPINSLENKFTYTDGIHTFVFNRLDYLLWKDSKDLKNFIFTFKSSVEHFSSQHLGEGQSDEAKVTDASIMHSFGNLALVTGGFNSSLSDKSIDEKVAMVDSLKEGNIASSVSLKLRLMCKLAKKEPGGWTDAKANAHKKDMIEVLYNQGNSNQEKIN